jgi:hypothetical protein
MWHKQEYRVLGALAFARIDYRRMFMTLKELYPRRSTKRSGKLPDKYSTWGLDTEVIEGLYGWLTIKNDRSLDVIVDVNSTKLQTRVNKIFQGDNMAPTNDGEYLYNLPFDAKNQALRLIGFNLSSKT